MTVDLKWRDAMVNASKAFDVAERVAGWPESMTPYQLADLQRPWVKGEPALNGLRQALADAIQRACAKGDLPHTVTTEQVRKPISQRSFMGTGSGKLRTFVQSVSFDASTYHIEAAPFAEWLRTQGEEPSEHIAHWFKVRGVAAPTVLRLTPPAPAVDAAPADPTTWAELVPWPGRKEPGFVWTVALKNIVAAERGKRGNRPGAAAAMAAELGFKGVERINWLVRTKDQHGKRETSANRRTGSK